VKSSYRERLADAGIGVNVAVTVWELARETVHVPTPPQFPLHPAKYEPEAGVAVSVAVPPGV